MFITKCIGYKLWSILRLARNLLNPFKVFYVYNVVSYCSSVQVSITYSDTDTENGLRSLLSLKIASCVCLGSQKKSESYQISTVHSVMYYKTAFQLSLNLMNSKLFFCSENNPLLPNLALIICRAFYSGRSFSTECLRPDPVQ